MFASRTDWKLTPNRLSQELEERRRRGLPVLDLTESNPTRCGFSYDAAEILAPLSDQRSLAYEPDPRGLLPARQAVAGYYAERGARVDPSQIFLTTSTSEAYTYVLRLLAGPQDSVLVPTPSYPLLDFLARLNDVQLVPYPLFYDHGWHLDRAVLETRLTGKSRAVLVVHPNNPTGSFVGDEDFRFLARLCRARGLALVSDEVFADYELAAAAKSPHPKTLSASGEVLTFTLSGLSKISALPQMKLAWIVASGPADLLSETLARLELIADTYLSVSAPLACALPRLLETRRAIQPAILERIRGNLAWLDTKLSGSQVRRLELEGGWYVTLQLPGVRSDEDWALDFLRQAGVLVYPGHFFDFPRESHVVLSLLPQADAFQKGVKDLLARVESAAKAG